MKEYQIHGVGGSNPPSPMIFTHKTQTVNRQPGFPCILWIYSMSEGVILSPK